MTDPAIIEEPQPLVREIAPAGAYPVQALGPLRAAVEAVEGQTQAPVAIPAASALATAALAVQAFGNVETLGGQRPCSLYFLTVAQSGERKSACDAPFMTAVRDHERDCAQASRADWAAWVNRQALWKAERDTILAKVKRGGAGDLGASRADLDALGPEPVAPPSHDRTASEPTFEGLTRLFATGQPTLGLFSDEGGQFLGGHAMGADHKQKTLAALNDLWQGNPIRRTRAGEGHMVLHGRRLSLHLMAQPGVVRAFLADPMAADTGFLARLLLAEPASTIGTRLQHRTRRDDAALAAFSDRLATILRTPLPMADPDTRELQPRLLELEPMARELLADFADTIELAQAPGGDLAHITGTASKTAEQAARIAGVLTLWTDLQASVVTADTMADAIELASFYLAEASRLASAALVSTEVDRAETLRRWLLERFKGEAVTSRDVVRSGPNALRESPKAKAALELLQRHGWLVRLEAGALVNGAARAEAWRVVRGQANAV